MREFEILIEDIDPCGGEQFARRSIVEIQAESPEVYVQENGRYPVVEQRVNAAGDTVIVTANNCGYMIRYTFSE